MSYLLDTNVISELRKGPRANAGVSEWASSVTDGELHISTLVVGELRQGVERLRRRDPLQASVLEDWLNLIKRRYEDGLIPVTAQIAERWGEINTPDRLPAVDGVLAATAIVHRMTLVTRNTKDIARTGVTTLNPFS